MNKILWGTGWYNVETFESKSFIWSGKEAELLLSDNSSRCIIFVFESNAHTAKSISISHGRLNEEYLLERGITSVKFYPDLSLKSASKIIIKTEIFVPTTVIDGSTDTRELGQCLRSINMDGDVIELSSIMSNDKINKSFTEIIGLESMGISTYCITLKSTPERQKYAEEHLWRHKINYTLFYGLDAKDLGISANVMTTQTYTKIDDWVTIGQVGCYISHYILWQNLESDRNNTILIVEDDVSLVPNFVKSLHHYLQSVPEDWELLYIGYESLDNIEHKCINNKVISGFPACTYAYMIKKSIIPLLLSELKPVGVPIDTQMRYKLKDKVKSYALTPQLAYQKSSLLDETQEPNTIFKSLTYDWDMDIYKKKK